MTPRTTGPSSSGTDTMAGYWSTRSSRGRCGSLATRSERATPATRRWRSRNGWQTPAGWRRPSRTRRTSRARRELERVPELTTRCLALSTSWLGAALCTQGWAAVQQGDVEVGIAKLKKGLTFFERAGVHGTYDYHRSALIEAHLTRGATDEALPIVRDALARCQTLLDCFHQAELHRLEGELLRRRGDEAGAETAFRAALELAGRQSARSYE